MALLTPRLAKACLLGIMAFMQVKFSAALSENKKADDAIRDISIKIKTQSGANIKYLLLFFTDGYNPLDLKDMIKRTIRPKTLWGIQAPLLILDNKITSQGLLAIAINGDDVDLHQVFTKNNSWEAVEKAFRQETKNNPGEKSFIFGSLPAGVDFHNYLRGINLSLGKVTSAVYAGFMKKYSLKNYLIVDDHVEEGALTLCGKGITVDCVRLSGYVPLGKPFKITRTLPEHNLIMEINNKPAIEIYKHYFEDQFENFKKHRFFSFYPLTLREAGKIRLASVLDSLEDGSLACLGNVKEGSYGNLSILHQPSLFKSIPRKIEPLMKDGGGFIFMVNSLLRKKALMDSYAEEIKLIKSSAGKNFTLAGIYTDYNIFPDRQKAELNMETGNLLLSLWK